MTAPATAPSTLLGLLQATPAERTAVIAPEQDIRLTYGDVRKQVQAIAEMLAAAGMHRGDRVGLALRNGIPNILSFLAASVVGTAAPLNPAYKEDEFTFYLEDTNARVLLLPPDGIDEARKAAGDRVPILTVDMDAAGTVTLRGVTGRLKQTISIDRRMAGADKVGAHKTSMLQDFEAGRPMELEAVGGHRVLCSVQL